MDSSVRPRTSDRERAPRAPTNPLDIDALVVDMEQRWGRGERPMVEMYLDQYEIDDPTHIRELIYAEYRSARRVGTPLSPEDYSSRFPNLRDSLTNLFELDRELEIGDDSVDLLLDRFPKVGDCIGPYFLERTLGEGSFARVFLARNRSLDFRPIVVKISRGSSLEKRLLARLDHPNLIPILDYHESADDSFQMICMPYRGMDTLKALIDALGDPQAAMAPGRVIALSETDQALLHRFDALKWVSIGPARTEGMVRIVIQIAEALAYVHGRGIAHNDVKPSNILIADDGTPLLFDFNVAVDQASLDSATASTGGTPAYLPPERIRELLGKQSGSGDSLLAGVRPDLYALALVLLECLSGRRTRLEPDPLLGLRAALGDLGEERAAGPRAFRDALRLVNHEIRPILRKALAADPAARYETAKEFAEDLRRFSDDLPPRHCFAWPSPARFARRNRRAITIAAVAVLLTGIGLGVVTAILRNESIELLESLVEDSGFASASIGPPLTTSRPRLHRLTLSGDVDTTNPANWRETIRYRLLGEEERAVLDALYFGTIQSWCRHFGPQSPQKRKIALRWLDLAISIEPDSSLRELRAELSGEPIPEDSRGRGAQGWLHDYLLGLSRFRLHARESLASFDRVLSVHPRLAAARFARASAAQRLGMREAAIDDLRRCVVDHPKVLEFRLRLAHALSASGSVEEARDVLHGIPQERIDLRTVLIKAAQGRAEELSTVLAEFLDLASDNIDSESKVQLLRKLEVIASRTSESTPAENVGTELEIQLEAVRRIRLDTPDQLLVIYRPYFLMKEAVLLERLGRFAEAASLYGRVVGTDPDHLLARYSLGQLQIHKNGPIGEGMANYRRVIEDPRFEELIAFDPKLIRMAFTYVFHSLKSGDPEAALEAASRALEVAHLQEVSRSEAHSWFATALAVIDESRPELEASGPTVQELSAALHFRRPGEATILSPDPHRLLLDVSMR